MKNYVAKLRENQEKGFSLVELIIVMAIMAILVGIVASQVIPYMEKSRQSKDQQQISSVASTVVSAVAQCPDDFNQGNLASDLTFDIKGTNNGEMAQALAASAGVIGTSNCQTVEDTFCELMGYSDLKAFAADYITASSQKKMTSKGAKDALTSNGALEVTLKPDGAVVVKVKGATAAKLEVKSE